MHFFYCAIWSMVRGMEIIQPVVEAFVGAVMMGLLVLSAMLFAVMMSHIVTRLTK